MQVGRRYCTYRCHPQTEKAMTDAFHHGSTVRSRFMDIGQFFLECIKCKQVCHFGIHGWTISSWALLVCSPCLLVTPVLSDILAEFDVFCGKCSAHAIVQWTVSGGSSFEITLAIVPQQGFRWQYDCIAMPYVIWLVKAHIEMFLSLRIPKGFMLCVDLYPNVSYIVILCLKYIPTKHIPTNQCSINVYMCVDIGFVVVYISSTPHIINYFMCVSSLLRWWYTTVSAI